MLQQLLKEELGKKFIERKKLPDYLEASLSPARKMRPYQEECLRYFLSYMEDYDDRLQRPHLLFHMATGSGKTLIMAATMLYLYEQGYRNFLFFVDTNNIVEKTKDNFLNAASSKYLFAPQIAINGKRVEVRQVENFQGASTDCINLCLTTIQGLHVSLNSNKENAPTYEDFSDQPVVLISDEAHHMNSDTKKKLTKEEETDKNSWEATEKRIFNCNNGRLPNVLLEFTATADLDDPNIAKKYEDKIIYDYPLKKFREDKYSKEVSQIIGDLDPIDRALQAIIVSQYKQLLFGSIRQNVKPVVMFKSDKIANNKCWHEKFNEALHELSVEKINSIMSRSSDVVKNAFEFFASQHISLDNLILQLQEEFGEEHQLLVDGNNISPKKQQLLNSLEESNNQIRAVFAVDMLNEGWDVLNLFDIVRMYETNDGKNGKPGNTTMQEAQLIGRGARYMPFEIEGHSSNMRKFDNDIDNPLRMAETLHYHCKNDTKYISLLKIALRQKGVIPDEHIQQILFFKDDFMEQELYTKGVVFMNARVPEAQYEDDGTIGFEARGKTYIVKMPTGKMKTGNLFSDDVQEVLTTETVSCRFHEVGAHVIRCAINCYPTFYFDNLKRLYPSLCSVGEFINSSDYLHDLNVKVIGREQCIEAYSQSDKLYIAKDVLRQLEPLLNTRGKSYRGTKAFKPAEFKSTFRKKVTLNFAKQANASNQEFGVSMKDSHRADLRTDLTKMDWYAYNDCFGTSEEKALIKYIEGIKDKLLEKYVEFYLVRNENDLKIYSFKTGAAFEPDFILFLRRRGKGTKFDNLQIFIEPKGENLRKQDAWKEEFLLEIKTMAEVQWCTSADDYNVWGVPFFTEQNNKEFYDAFNREIVADTIPCGQEEMTEEKEPFRVLDSSEVSVSDRFSRFLPLYSIKAACGPHEFNFSDEGLDNDLGWIEASEFGHTLNKDMFVVQAVGHSMEPNIKDGAYCVFEWYCPENGGSRDGKIVLAKDLSECDGDYSGRFTIKKYHRVSDKKSELRSINSGHPTFILEPDGEFDDRNPVIATFIGVL